MESHTQELATAPSSTASGTSPSILVLGFQLRHHGLNRLGLVTRGLFRSLILHALKAACSTFSRVYPSFTSVAGAETNHYLARPREARRHPARTSAGALGSGDRGRSTPLVLGSAGQEDGAPCARQAASRQRRPHPSVDRDTAQRRPEELHLVPAASGSGRLCRRQVHSRGHEPPRRAFYLRCTKEAMVYFPEHQADGH